MDVTTIKTHMNRVKDLNPDEANKMQAHYNALLSSLAREDKKYAELRADVVQAEQAASEFIRGTYQL